MLYTIAVALLIMWLLGLVSGYTFDAFVQLLLVIAVVLFLTGLVSGRREAGTAHRAREAAPTRTSVS